MPKRKGICEATRQSAAQTGELKEVRAVRMAAALAIEWLEGASGEAAASSCFQLETVRELLKLAQTRTGAAAEIEGSLASGDSLGVTVGLRRYLPEFGPRDFETVVVDMPGGASASRCVH
jgi:hypothetical protein